MTHIIRLDVIRLFTVGMLLSLPPTTSWAQRPVIADQVAKTYGVDSFGQVEAIRFTFNAEQFSRKWEWNPQTDTFPMRGKTRTASQ